MKVFSSKLPFLALFFSIFISVELFAVNEKLVKLIDQKLEFSAKQYSLFADKLRGNPKLLPRTLDKEGKLLTSDAKWWCSGFFPGTLWYLSEFKADLTLKQDAEQFSERIVGEQYTKDNHDVGFMIYCSYGNAYRLDPIPAYKEIILTTARSLSTRYRSKVGLIRSWDWGKWQYPVIIDNMMNLELLFNATKFSGDSSFYKIAVSHAEKTMKYHFRDDASCYHVASYDSISGLPVWKGTRQGLNDSSSWARGQAWAIYGYTMVYRETRDPRFLNHALRIANFLLNHPRMPKDLIPYWDFDAPNIPAALRDASAGAIICSALIELSTYVKGAESTRFLNAAETQILALSSPEYLARLGENGLFLLKHSVGSFPDSSEVDVPLTYADYYYVEAMMRYKKLNQGKK